MLEPISIFPPGILATGYGFDVCLDRDQELVKAFLVWLLTRAAEKQERAQSIELFLKNGHLSRLRKRPRGMRDALTISTTELPANERVNCRNGFNLPSMTISSNARTLLGISGAGGAAGGAAAYEVEREASLGAAAWGLRLWAIAKSSMREVAASSLVVAMTLPMD